MRNVPAAETADDLRMAWSGASVPIAVVGAGKGADCAPVEANYKHFYDAAPAPKWQVRRSHPRCSSSNPPGTRRFLREESLGSAGAQLLGCRALHFRLALHRLPLPRQPHFLQASASRPTPASPCSATSPRTHVVFCRLSREARAPIGSGVCVMTVGGGGRGPLSVRGCAHHHPALRVH